MTFDEMDRLKEYAKLHQNDDIDPEQAAKIAQEMIDRISGQHVFRQYQQHINTKNAQNTRPEHAFGEKLYAAFLCAAAATKHDIVKKFRFVRSDRTEIPRHLGVSIAFNIAASQLYQWTDKCEEIADASPLPKHTISRSILPFPIMFWSRETGYVGETPEHFETNWMCVLHTGDGIRFICDVTYNSERTEFVLMDIPYGMVWPDDFSSKDQYPIGRLLKRCAFLNSPYVTSERRKLPRHIRRQMEKLGEEPINEEAHVVALRRISVRNTDSLTGEQRDVEWQHQWWVSAHYRAQWYPTEKAHKVIWIAPHLKGPSDKPILEKMYAVVR